MRSAALSLQIVWGFYAIVTRVDNTYEVTLTAEVRQFLSHLSVFIDFGLGDASSILTCMGVQGYVARLVFWMALPLALTCIILVTCSVYLMCKRRFSAGALFMSALPILLRMFFVGYPVIANAAFEAFSCYPAFDDGRQVLIADVAIECYQWSGTWHGRTAN